MSPPDPITEPPRSAHTVGEQLKAARLARGWSAADVATRLRIRPALVEALERGEYAPFLAAAYARGQVRNYARLTGLDEQALLANFVAPPLDPIGRALHQAPELHPRRPWLVRLGAFTVVGVLIVLGALWAGVDHPPQVPPEPPRPVEMALPSVAQPSAEPVPASEQPEPVAAPPADVSPNVVEMPAEPLALPAQASKTPATELQTATAGGPELRLRSRAVSWVEVTDHRGQRLIYELVGPNVERVVSGAPPLRLLLGNAPAMEVVFAGQPVALPPGQHVVRMTLGAAESPPVATPPSAEAAPAVPNL